MGFYGIDIEKMKNRRNTYTRKTNFMWFGLRSMSTGGVEEKVSLRK